MQQLLKLRNGRERETKLANLPWHGAKRGNSGKRALKIVDGRHLLAEPLPQRPVLGQLSNRIEAQPDLINLFQLCPVCGGEIIEKEVKKLIPSGNNTAVVRVNAEVVREP